MQTAQPQLERDVVEHSDLRAQHPSGVLLDVADASPTLPGSRRRAGCVCQDSRAAPGAHGVAADVHQAGARSLLTEQHPQQRRLARAVGALHDDPLARLHHQAQPAHGSDVTGGPPIEAEEVAHLDGRGHRRSVPGRDGERTPQRGGRNACRTEQAQPEQDDQRGRHQGGGGGIDERRLGGRAARGDRDQGRRGLGQHNARDHADGHADGQDRTGPGEQLHAQPTGTRAVRLPREQLAGRLATLGENHEYDAEPADQQPDQSRSEQQPRRGQGHRIAAQQLFVFRPQLHRHPIEGRPVQGVGHGSRRVAGRGPHPHLRSRAGARRQLVHGRSERRAVEHCETTVRGGKTLTGGDNPQRELLAFAEPQRQQTAACRGRGRTVDVCRNGPADGVRRLRGRRVPGDPIVDRQPGAGRLRAAGSGHRPVPQVVGECLTIGDRSAEDDPPGASRRADSTLTDRMLALRRRLLILTQRERVQRLSAALGQLADQGVAAARQSDRQAAAGRVAHQSDDIEVERRPGDRHDKRSRAFGDRRSVRRRGCCEPSLQRDRGRVGIVRAPVRHPWQRGRRQSQQLDRLSVGRVQGERSATAKHGVRRRA